MTARDDGESYAWPVRDNGGTGWHHSSARPIPSSRLRFHFCFARPRGSLAQAGQEKDQDAGARVKRDRDDRRRKGL